MSKSCEVVTLNAEPRLIDRVLLTMHDIHAFRLLDSWPIVEEDPDERGRIVGFAMAVEGWKPLVKFLSWATDYHGPNGHKAVLTTGTDGKFKEVRNIV